MDPVLRFIVQRPWSVLLLLLAVSTLAFSQIVDPTTGELQLRLDVSTNRLLPEDDEGKQFYDFVRELFGSDETMIVALSSDDVFTAENLRRVQRMTRRISALPEVHHVVSLSNALDVRSSDDEIRVQPFADEIPESSEELDRIRAAVLDNPMHRGNLVSESGRTTALVIYFLNFSDAQFIEQRIDTRISQIAREEAGDAKVWVTGGPHIKMARFDYLRGDLRRGVPLVLAAAALVLAFSFRTLRGVLLPLTPILVTLLWTLGVVGFIGHPLNMVTSLIVPLFAILPLSYCVHVVSGYYDTLRRSSEATSRDAVGGTLGRVWVPVSLTGLTTAAGFLALTLSPIGAIREFGVLAVAGVLASVVASLTVPSALLAISARPRRLGVTTGDDESDAFTRFASRVATFNLGNRRAIFVASGVVFALALLASTWLQVGAQSVKNFPADSRVRLDFENVNRELQGANLFNVVVRADEADAFEEPASLKELESLQTWLEAQPEIGDTTSVVEYLELCNRGFFEKLELPASRLRTSQSLFFCASDELEGFLDSRRQIANVVVRANVIDTDLVSALVTRIEERLRALAPSLSATVTGNPILMSRLFDDIARGQARSLVAAFVFIYLILAVMFLSWRTAALALIPNVLPVAFYFGALGVTGVKLSFATSLIAPMALGIAIDDTIHYFSRFKEDAKRTADEKRATISALRTVGRPVTYTTIAICVCFATLGASDLRGFVQFGALGAATLAFAWVVDFTLTPALCSGLRFVTLWDTLTLDLGDDPQSSIPLFTGLSNWACRIVAQVASLREVPAGHPLMRVGDRTSEMYLIIDGQARAWIDSGDGQVELNTHRRGDPIGELGMLTGEPRSANIDIVADTRLLRLTPNNLERLRRRHPRIASRLFWNLNELQARRLQKQTEKMR